jgi:hypothetical protein
MARSVDQLLGLLPPNWGSFSPEQKIAFYNANNVTPTELLSVGVAPTDLSFMFSRGYSGGGGMMSPASAPVAPPPSADNPPSPNDDVAASPPSSSSRYTNIRTVAGQEGYADSPGTPDRYYATDSTTGEEVELLSTSEYSVGRGPEGTTWLARPLGGLQQGQSGIYNKSGLFRPFEAVDAQGNVIGTWEMAKNDPSKTQQIGVAVMTAIAASVMGPAVGAALGLSGTAAAVVGNAIVNGASTGFITGDAEKAAIAALTSAAGSYISQSGIISDALNAAGLSEAADFIDTNLVTQNVAEATSNGTLSSVVDAANNTITTIGSNIGVNTVADTIAAAASGLLSTAADGTQTVTQTGTRPTTTQPTTGEALLTGTANVAVTDLPGGGQQVTQTGTPTTQQPTVGDGLLSGAANVTLTDLPGGGQEIVQTETPKPETPEPTLPVVIPPPGSGPLLSTNTGPATTPEEPPTDLSTNLRTLLTGTGLLSDLLGTGIDATLLNEIENLSAGKAEDVRRAFDTAAKDVQFTPYTVTTGFGSTAFGTDAAGKPTATATASPEYQALRNQALQQAGTALGSINPADSAQALYDRARALSAPTEQRQQEQLLSNLGARGLLGIGRNLPTVGGTTAAVNPYLESLLSAQRTADANLALQSQQFGTQEAMRQQQLAQALQGQGMAVDTAAQGLFAPSLSFGTQAAATAGQSADRSLRATQLGETLATTYDLANLDARTQLLRAQAEAAKGVTSNVLPKFLDLFGL